MTENSDSKPPASVPDNVIDLAAAKQRFAETAAETAAEADAASAAARAAADGDAGILDADAQARLHAMIDATLAGHWQGLQGPGHTAQPLKPLPLVTPPAWPMRFQIDVDLNDTAPPIWRQLDVPSSIRLDRLHLVLQTAFGWADSHLHQFTVGYGPEARETERIVTAVDIAEGEEGVPEHELRLDQLLANPGDAIFYTYDFGDDWSHTVTLRAVTPVDIDHASAPEPTLSIVTDAPATPPTDTPDTTATDAPVRCFGGARRGPPDDSGGAYTYESILAARELGHPDHNDLTHAISHFGLSAWRFTDEIDIDAINRGFDRLAGADAALAWLQAHAADKGVAPLAALVDKVARAGKQAQLHLSGYLAGARITDPVEVDEAEAARATAVIRGFLTYVGDGITLTSAGFLPPKHVVALMAELDPEGSWGPKPSTETNTRPLLNLRDAATGLGLVRKTKGVLLPTKFGAALRESPLKLWRFLAERLPYERGEFAQDVGRLRLMLVAAGEAGDQWAVQDSLDLLTSVLGWQFEDGSGHYGNAEAAGESRGTYDVVGWAGSGTLIPDPRLINQSESGRFTSPGAVLLARAALKGGASG